MKIFQNAKRTAHFLEDPKGGWGWWSAKAGGPDCAGNGFNPWPIEPDSSLDELLDGEPLRRYSKVQKADVQKLRLQKSPKVQKVVGPEVTESVSPELTPIEDLKIASKALGAAFDKQARTGRKILAHLDGLKKRGVR